MHCISWWSYWLLLTSVVWKPQQCELVNKQLLSSEVMVFSFQNSLFMRPQTMFLHWALYTGNKPKRDYQDWDTNSIFTTHTVKNLLALAGLWRDLLAVTPLFTHTNSYTWRLKGKDSEVSQQPNLLSTTFRFADMKATTQTHPVTAGSQFIMTWVEWGTRTWKRKMVAQ